jgi:glycosyltransferase involved in cell wall biosynthesis
MSDSSDIAVVGLARDCEATLDATLARIEVALSPGRLVHWCVVESDSSDRTPELLTTLAARRPRFTALSLGKLKERLPLRTQRIAHCRNAYLDWLRETTSRATIGHVLVTDLDGVIDRLDAEGLASCWLRADWSVCAANVEGPYYDIWALRHPEWCPGDCWREADFLIGLGASVDRARYAAVYSRMICLPPEAEWIEVESAFGGMALYRTEALLGARYHGLAADGGEVCEHVALHAQIRASGGRILINPRLLASSGTPHDPYLAELRVFVDTVDRLTFRTLLRLLLGRDTARTVRRVLRALI